MVKKDRPRLSYFTVNKRESLNFHPLIRSMNQSIGVKSQNTKRKLHESASSITTKMQEACDNCRWEHKSCFRTRSAAGGVDLGPSSRRKRAQDLMLWNVKMVLFLKEIVDFYAHFMILILDSWIHISIIFLIHAAARRKTISQYQYYSHISWKFPTQNEWSAWERWKMNTFLFAHDPVT